MPTYEYACKKCGERFDVFQSFSEKALTKHPGCGGNLQKVFHPAGIIFKGSGFYVTDSKSSRSTSSSSRSSGSTSGSSRSSSSTSGSSTSRDSKTSEPKSTESKSSESKSSSPKSGGAKGDE